MKCNNKATHKYYWPGTTPKYACSDCLYSLVRTATAMGFYLHTDLLQENDERRCEQNVSDRTDESRI